jgi:CHAD domain-containing protein
VTNSIKDEVDSLIVGAMLRDFLRTASSEIESADLVVKENRTASLLDDPESIRKLRLSFRRVQYLLETMDEIEKIPGTKILVRRLHEVGAPFGGLRDAEVLEQRVTKGLGTRGGTAKGLQLISLAGEFRHHEQLSVQALLDSNLYRGTLEALKTYRSSLEARNVSLITIRPLAQRVLKVSWLRLKLEVKKTKFDDSDDQLHHLRITAKRVLYSTQAFMNVLDPPGEEFARRLDLFQKFLGKQHDQVMVTQWAKSTAKDQPSLKKLAKTLASEERKRASANAKHWPSYWDSIRDLHPRQLW